MRPFKPCPPPEVLSRLRGQIEARVVRKPTGCWEWPGSGLPSGYGQVWCPETRQAYMTHRVMVWATGRETPGFAEVDHLCRNKKCCNPEHLDVVSKQENALRGLTGMHRAESARLITHCPRGHDYTPENTYVCKRRKRYCRECQRVRLRERKIRLAG